MGLYFWNYLALGINILLIIKAFKDNNLIHLFFYGVFLVLVIFQSFNITYNLVQTNYNNVQYLGNNISLEGHRLACIFVVIILLIIYFLQSRKYERKNQPIDEQTLEFSFSRKPSLIYYSVTAFIIFAAAGILIAWKGSSIIDDTRPGTSGVTFFLVILGIGIYPLLFKLSSYRRVTIIDILFASFSMLLLIFFSRILVIFHLLHIGIIVFYRGYLTKVIKLSKYKFHLFFGIVFLIAIFLLMGSYKHLKNFTDSANLSFIESIKFALSNPEQGLFSVDVIYHLSIEGMSGFSGVLSEFLRTYELKFDLGMSALVGIFTMIPSFIRGAAFSDFVDYLQTFYWHTGSVLAPGLENAFVHFSFVGVILYPFVLSRFMNFCDINLRNAQRKRYADLALIQYSLFATYGILLIRGNTRSMLFYMICYFIIFKICVMFKRLVLTK